MLDISNMKMTAIYSFLKSKSLGILIYLTISTLILFPECAAQNFKSVNLRVDTTEILYAEIPSKLGTSLDQLFLDALPLAGAENIVTFVKSDRLPMLQVLKFGGRAELTLATFSEVIRQQFKGHGIEIQNEYPFTAKIKVSSTNQSVWLKTFVNKFDFIDPSLSNELLSGTLMLIPAKDFHLTVTFIEEARKAAGNSAFRNRIFKSIRLSTDDSFYFPIPESTNYYNDSFRDQPESNSRNVSYTFTKDQQLNLDKSVGSSTSIGKIIIGLILALGGGLIYKKKLS